MVSDHINYLTFEDPGAVHTVRRALKLAHAGDLYGAAETAGVDVAHAAIVSQGLRRGMRYSIGAEVDNDPRARPDAQNIVDAMRPDGIIRSVHFLSIDHPEKGADWMWPFDNAEFVQFFEIVGVERTWELYMARLIDDIEKLPGHIVGHFYVPAKFGHWPSTASLEKYEDRLLDACLARGMAVEINTRFLYRENAEDEKQKYREANMRLMRKAKAKGVGIAIGSDAHSPKDQGGAFEDVLRMLDECEINEIVFPVGGRLARVALRATKEHLEKQQLVQEPVQPGSSISGLSRAELGLPEEPEKAELESTAKARDVSPRKRTTGPTRATARAEGDTPEPKSSAKRTAESAASSARAKEEKVTKGKSKPAKAAPEKTAPAKAAPAKATPAKAAPVVQKPAAKAPAKAAAAPAKAKAVKAPPKSAATVKPAAKKATPQKAAAKSMKPAAKAASAKKAPAKKAVAPAKKAAPKKTPAKAAAKPAKSSVKKPAAKKAATASRPVKKASKPSSKGTTTKKKPATKRR
jgi:HisJ family histidinol phosphate phosphatase